MSKLLSLIICISLLLIVNLTAIEYENLYNNGKVAELRTEIYSQPHFNEDELPRAAFYESLVTSKNFDQTLQELIEGFPEIEYKDQVNFKLGIVNFFQRQYSQAEFYFSKIDNTKDLNEYNYWLARLFFMKQEPKQSSHYAGVFLKNCPKIDHKYELSFYMLIENSIDENNFQKAVVLAEELLMKKPEGINRAFLYYRIGHSYERLENMTLALANYKKSFEEDPYGQYAATIEEKLFDLKQGNNKNLDISFLYAKNYNKNNNRRTVTYKTEPKEFNVAELVKTDTISVLNKFFNAQNDQVQKPLETPAKSVINNPKQEPVPNKPTDTNLVAKTPVADTNLSSITPPMEKKQENRVIENKPAVQNNDGVLLDRPKNVEVEGYIYSMNKPVGKFFIQIGRFSQKEFAVNRTKELFFLQQTWNIFRDAKGANVQFVVWSKAYDTALAAKKDIALLKSKNVDCFLIANE